MDKIRDKVGRQGKIAKMENIEKEEKRRGIFRRNKREKDKISLWQRLKKSIHDHSFQLKWRFGLYLPVCIILGFTGSLAIGNLTNYLQDYWLYEHGAEGEQDARYEYWYDEHGVIVRRLSAYDGSNAAYGIVTLLQLFMIPTWILFSVYLTGKLFYNRELKEPIQLLLDASRRIADNQLDFCLEYNKPNELGILCRAFDEMRRALYDSNRQLWRSLEERKRLNAAFSHDLRTPLTVLRGYADFLEKYVPGGNVSEEKLLEVLGMMSGQIIRLEHYTQTMNSVQRLGDIVPSPALVPAQQIENSFLRTGELLCGEKRFVLIWQVQDGLYLDGELVLQIYENLVSNACRYAAECVSVKCAVENGMFVFAVEDDGKGFGPEALRCASEPFFRDEREPDKTHFGLGLYICRILCEKCGGMLTIGNARNAGGEVCGGRVTVAVSCKKAPGR